MPISFQLAGSAHCLPPGRCVMATPPPPPPTLGFQGQGGQLPISRGGGSGGTRLRVVGSCEGARLGRPGFSSAQLASPSEATPPNPGITANFRLWKMKGLGTLGLVLVTGESALAGVPVNYTDLKAHPHWAIHLLCDHMLVT